MHKITGVAIKRPEKLWTLPPPYRHGDIIAIIAARGYQIPVTGEQGFITDDGQFINREDALILVRENGQLLKEYHPKYLFSEDLW